MNHQNLSLLIARVNAYGLGVAELAGQKYLVPFVLPGEEVEVRPLGKRGSGIYCELVGVLRASPNRVTPPCPYFGSCGGCDLQQADYAAQLALKQQWLKTLFARFPAAEVAAILPAPAPLHYRNRITLHSDGRQIGFHRRGSHEVIAIESCAIASAAVNEKLAAERTRSVRKSGAFEIREDDESGAFMQVNTRQNEALIQTVLKLARVKKSERVLELYAGSGNLSFALAQAAREVIAIEGDARAVKAAEQRRLLLGVKNARFLAAPAFEAAYRLAEDYENFGLVVADPPREGLREVVKILPRFSPKKIVLVSCDPHAHIKDAEALAAKGFALKLVQPIDMFPQTRHIEIVAAFTRE